MRARPFHRQQYRAAPFATDANALQHAQDSQDHGAPDADRGVGRHKGDEKSGDAHAQERGDQRALAADTVAVMTKDRSADRTPDEADEVGAECRECRSQWVFIGKIEFTEDQAGSGAVDEEVVPLDSGADGSGDDGFAELCAVVGSGQRIEFGCDSYEHSPVAFLSPNCAGYFLGQRLCRKDSSAWLTSKLRS